MELNDNLNVMNTNDLLDINGGFTKQDALGILAEAGYLAAVGAACVGSGGAALIFAGGALVAMDAM